MHDGVERLGACTMIRDVAPDVRIWGLARGVQRPRPMPAIDNLMKRLGFAKLADYGLVLTPEDRVISMRPAVLDDGFGGKIVGWKDGDLAAAEHEPWGAARPASKQAVAPRLATPPAVRATAPGRVVPAAPMVPARPVAAPLAIAPERVAPVQVAPAIPAAPEVAAAPVVEEDDWEWTIAIARARAAEVDAPRAAPAVTPPVVTLPAVTLPSPLPVRAPRGPDPRPAAELSRIARGTPAPIAAPRTVIPVPMLPTLAGGRPAHLDPVVRSRLAKGTGPHHPNTVARPHPSEDTVLTLAPAPASEDTVPAIVLAPAPARRLPSIKRESRG